MNKIMRKKRVFLILILFLVSLLWIAPLAVTVMQSFAPIPEPVQKNDRLEEMLAQREQCREEKIEYLQPEILPKGFSLEQYRRILTETPVYLHSFWNSIWITTAAVAGGLVVSLLGAYGFTILHWKGKEALFYLYIVVMLLPLQVTMMPNYMIAGLFGIEDSPLAIILPAIFHPFGVFLLRQQMKLLPEECIEAAKIDGAGYFRIFTRIMIPLVKSGIGAFVMLQIIEYWNLIDQAVIFIKKTEQQPLSVFLAKMNDQADEVAAAGAVYYMIPVLMLLAYGHEYLKEGIGLLNHGH